MCPPGPKRCARPVRSGPAWAKDIGEGQRGVQTRQKWPLNGKSVEEAKNSIDSSAAAATGMIARLQGAARLFCTVALLRAQCAAAAKRSLRLPALLQSSHAIHPFQRPATASGSFAVMATAVQRLAVPVRSHPHRHQWARATARDRGHWSGHLAGRMGRLPLVICYPWLGNSWPGALTDRSRITELFSGKSSC